MSSALLNQQAFVLRIYVHTQILVMTKMNRIADIAAHVDQVECIKYNFQKKVEKFVRNSQF